MTVSDVLLLLQDLGLPDQELDELTTALAKEGLSESVTRRVQRVLMREANLQFSKLQSYQQAHDLLVERDAKIAEIEKSATQDMNKLAMQTDAKLDSIGRKLGEDDVAAKGGATLLLHSDDITPATTPHSAEPAAAESAPADDSVSAPIVEPMQTISPKEAAAAVIESSRVPAMPVSPTSFAAAPIMSNEPDTGAMSVTNTPLPKTSIASSPVPASSATTPPAVTEPGA